MDNNLIKKMIETCFRKQELKKSLIEQSVYQQSVSKFFLKRKFESLMSNSDELKDVGILHSELNMDYNFKMKLQELELNDDNIIKQLLPFIDCLDDITLIKIFLNEAYNVSELSSHQEVISYACLLFKLCCLKETYSSFNLLQPLSFFKVISPCMMVIIKEIFGFCDKDIIALESLKLIKIGCDFTVYTNLESNKMFQIFFRRMDRFNHRSYFKKLFSLLTYDNYNFMDNKEYISTVFAYIWKQAEQAQYYGEDYCKIFKSHINTTDIFGCRYIDYVKMNIDCKSNE